MSASLVSSASSAQRSVLLRMNPIAAQRAKKEIEKRRADIKTYTVPIIFDGDADHKAFLRSHHKKYSNSRKTSLYRLQVMKKYPSTVAKFYHNLVEHSGRVTSEQFWMRYDYRCCDFARVLKEVQLVNLECKKELVKNKKKGKRSSKELPFVKGVARSTELSWMNFSAYSKKSQEPLPPSGIEAAATEDTADEECNGDDDVNHDVVNHVEKFKQSLHLFDVRDASPVEITKGCDERGLLTQESNLDSILRRGSNKEMGLLQRMQVPAILMGVWLLTVIMASMIQLPSLWLGVSVGNKVCSPIRPGTVLDAQELSQKYGVDRSLVFAAPWWAPSKVKNKAFDYLCATNVRKKTQIKCDIGAKKFFRREDAPFLSVTVDEIGGDENLNNFVRVRSIRSLSTNPAGTKLKLQNINGREKEYDSPWAVL
ncbi:hypothetical protein IV203_004470 [Nitzschia inconspicua]|uniref:Uncharacterized protein n=1 Tax=Nitzschia inconspicua TaxID=303405 RepID=A0A9K3L3T1_9STRA|nr:hypothetical protein IV203_004470 [Nitzschia inconspicua]